MNKKKQATIKATQVAAAPLNTGVADLAAELATARKQAQEYLEGWKRAQADYQNYLKRTQIQHEKFARTATAEVIRRVLPILDNLEQVTKHAASSSAGELTKGVELVVKQLREVLTSQGVSEIKVRGVRFDPAVHEAVANVAGPKDFCVIEHARGYKLCDLVLRPSRVSVGNGK
ncbi:MAG: nucleotide exchange factor GrpE [Parcubacteria group bacterium]